MSLRLDLTSDLLHRLELIAAANHRELKEQVLYYLEWAITIEWDINGADIEAKLAHRQAQQDAYWLHRPCKARRLHVDLHAITARQTHG
jgi:hypothetical protein